MKTDKETIVNESLENAALNYSHNFAPGFYEQSIRFRTFKDAAQWQKEQLLPLLQSHAELLEALIYINERLNERDMYSNIVSEAIEKANQLNNK